MPLSKFSTFWKRLSYATTEKHYYFIIKYSTHAVTQKQFYTFPEVKFIFHLGLQPQLHVVTGN